MENGKMFRNQAKTEAPNWDNSIFVPEIHHNSLNFGSELLSDCFFDPNWKTSGDQTDPFESALSSIVSSPATPVAGTSGDDCFVLRELVGKLGSISNSGNDKKSACHSTMVLDHRISGNSPFLPNSTLFSGEPGFSGGNPTCSWLGNGNPGGLKGQTGLNFNGFSHGSTKIPPSDNKITTFSRSENGEFGDSKDESSVSEKNPGAEIEIKAQNHTNPRKRKSNPGGKEKEIPLFFKPQEAETESEAIESEKARSNENEKQSNENQKPPTEPIKDYIHVRARRGQATDSHSLAERVRREKIGERMKFLQDLVPGCNKVTGKAVMLDEIINYVQSLQRQVEFLSMKLANVNPMMDSKDIFQSIYPMGGSTTYGFQSQQGSNQSHNFFSINQLNAAHLLPMTGFGEAAASQDSKLWEDDFQSLIRMGFGQN